MGRGFISHQRPSGESAGLRAEPSSYWHPPVAGAQTEALKTKIVAIAHARRRFGYRRVHDLLRTDFPGVNSKRVYRLY